MFDAVATAVPRLFAACGASAINIVPTWYKYLGDHDVGGKCTPIFNFPADIPRILLAIFEIVLYIGGIVAVVYVIYGGFLYLTTQGEPDRAANARTTILNAIVGLVISMLSVVIVNLIGRNILQ